MGKRAASRERPVRRLPGKTGWGWAALFGPLSALVLLQASPWVVQTPGNDSGIFLYFGAQILRGRLPFTQLWDHKPPLVFYIDALGLWLGAGSRWGVWALEVLSLTAASLLAFYFLRRYFGTWAALLAVTGMLASLAFVLEGGNLTEEYALPFQFAGLALFAGAEGEQKPGWRGYLMGVAMGCAFLLKQTLIGVWLTITVYLIAGALFNRSFRRLALLAQALTGFALVVAASLAYFAFKGGLSAYWDVAFWYNFVYSTVAAVERLDSFLEVVGFLNVRAGFFILAATAWVAGIIHLLLHHADVLRQVTRRRAGLLFLAGALLFLLNGLFDRPFHLYALAAISSYRWALIGIGAVLLIASLFFFFGWTEGWLFPRLKAFQSPGADPVALPLILALVDLPVNLSLVSLSGRGYLHYYLSLFPSLTILVAFLAWSLAGANRGRAERALPAIWSAALLLPVLYSGVSYTVEKIHPGADLQTTETVSYIRANTHPEDTVLLWGTQTGIYYLSGRDSPTRFVHQIPLFNARYGTGQRIQEFVDDLALRKPALIIDTRLPAMPLVNHAGDPAGCSQPRPGEQAPAGLEPAFAFICSHYVSVGIIGPDSWVIYRYNPAVQTNDTLR